MEDTNDIQTPVDRRPFEPIVLPLVVSAKVVWVRQYQDDLGYWRDATAHPCWSEHDAMIDLVNAKIGCESLPMRIVKRVIVDSFVTER